MKEAAESTVKAMKDRLTSPFYGKLILAWFLWNWKVPYVTFFVKEENIEGKNKLEFIADYLKPDSVLNFCSIYLIPIIIAVTLIWIFPYITQEAFKSSEKFRKKKAKTIKDTNAEIDNFKDVELDRLRKLIEGHIDDKNELRLLSEYLSYELELVELENYDETIDDFQRKYDDEIQKRNVGEKVQLHIDNYNKSIGGDTYLINLPEMDKEFLINNVIIRKEKDRFSLTDFGEFVSKRSLYRKYHNIIDDFFLRY